MRETQTDREALQALIDASVTRAGDYLRSSLEMPAKTLSANQLVNKLDGMLEVAFATVTAKARLCT